MSFGLPVVVLFELTICLFWVWEYFSLVGIEGWGWLVGFKLGWGVPVSFLVDNPGFFVKECRFRMNTVLTSISIEKSVR